MHEARVDHVEQLSDHDADSTLRVGLRRTRDVGENEPLFGREKHVQEQLPVIRAPVAIAVAMLRRHQVERRPLVSTWEGRVVESRNDDDAVRHNAHGLEGTHRHPAAQEPTRQRIVPEHLLQPIAHDRQLERAVALRVRLHRRERAHGREDDLELALLVVAVGCEKCSKRRAQLGRPGDQ